MPGREKLKSCSKWFPTEEGAKEFKSEHEGDGAAFGELAMSAAARARWWAINEQCRGAGVSVEVAIAAGLEALKKLTPKTETIETAFGLWEIDAVKRKLRPDSVKNIKRWVGAYAKGRESTLVNQVAGADVLAWIEARYADPVSREDVRTRLLTFFRWCSAKPRQWCRVEEFADVKWEHEVKRDTKRIGFYTAAETAAILDAAPANLKPALALGFFAGLRPFEMNRVVIRWEHEGEVYGFDEAAGKWHIAPSWAKTRAYRQLYDLPDCWWYWWIKYNGDIHARDRKGKKHRGKLVPTNYRNFRRALGGARKRAGVRRNPSDGIRHSFGTHGYHRSADGRARGVEWCIANMGHVSGFRVFETRYNGKVGAAEAEAYFLIYPAGAACAWRKGLRSVERVIVSGKS